MPAPTTGILDNFNRANAGSLGANWTQLPLGGASAHTLQTNAASVGGTSYHADYWNPATFGPDSECYFTWVAATGEREIYVRLNGTLTASATTNGYSAYGAVSGSPTWNIFRYDNGAFTSIAGPTSITWAANDVIFLQAVGTTLALYKNGTSQMSGTSSAYNVAGRIGFTTGVVSASTPSDDDFGGGTIVAASGLRPPVRTYLQAVNRSSVH